MNLIIKSAYNTTMLPTFEEKLRSDQFILTAEVEPPKGTDIAGALEDAAIIRNWVDAVNITDNQRAVMRMSPLALGKLLVDAGHEVIMQMTCRDRNRLSLQSDILGASALGIRNICVMSGDHTTKGDHPGAKPVYDLDPVQLISLIGKMGQGSDLAGNDLNGSPQLVVGAVSNIDPSRPMQMLKLEKKVATGARFIQTQAVYDIGQFEEFLDAISHLDVPVLAGVIPLKSARMARFMNEKIPGIKVEEDLIKRMEGADDPAKEGSLICAEQINEFRKMCRGIHLMPIGHHQNTPQLLKMAGFSERS